MICLKQIVILAVAAIALFGSSTEAGFRCSVVGGFLNIFSSEARSAACSASCVTLGHTSGICASDGECHCSTKSIDLDGLMELIPSRCDLGEEFCAGTCHSIGRREGQCITKSSGEKDCQCSQETVSAEEFAKCAAEETCRVYCQANGSASGECRGWSCKCI